MCVFLAVVFIFPITALSQINKLEISPKGQTYKHIFKNTISVVINDADQSNATSLSIKIFKQLENGNLSSIEKFDIPIKDKVQLKISRNLDPGQYIIQVELYETDSYKPSSTIRESFELIDKKVLLVSNDSISIHFLNKNGKYTYDTEDSTSSFKTTPTGIGAGLKKQFITSYFQAKIRKEDFIISSKFYNSYGLDINHFFEVYNQNSYRVFATPTLSYKRLFLLSEDTNETISSETADIYDLGFGFLFEKRINKKIIVDSSFNILPAHFSDEFNSSLNYDIRAGIDFFIEFPISMYFQLLFESFNYKINNNDFDYTNTGFEVGLKYSF
jgi:hypothetical protein